MMNKVSQSASQLFSSEFGNLSEISRFYGILIAMFFDDHNPPHFHERYGREKIATDIVAEKRAITADTDLRLCRFFGLSNGYWLRAQAAYDTEVAERKLGPELTKIKPRATVAA